jgi:hypothetical protein
VSLPLAASAQEDVTPYIQRMIQYYLHYGQSADSEIEALLDYIESVDPGQGTLWRGIMEDWRWNNEEMTVNRDLLPDGLPQDDSLCIVVMGYCLNRDGSMKRELLGRLRVALESAKKYPNAYILCTGGPTAANRKTTEADQMRQWLAEQGIEWERIIVEKRSLSTTENAMYSLPVLQKLYPSIQKLAVVTSDYHVRRSCLMFGVTAEYNAGYHNYRPLEVVGNAAYVMGYGPEESFFTQTWGIAIVAGVQLNRDNPPPLEWMPEKVETAPMETEFEEVPPTETVPMETMSLETMPMETEPMETVPAVMEEVPAAEEQKTGDLDCIIAVLAIIAGFAGFVAAQAIWERRKNA